jgi:hypothetical protein
MCVRQAILVEVRNLGTTSPRCHIQTRSAEDVARAFATYLCAFYGECAADEAYRQQTAKTFHEVWSNVPVLGAPSSIWLASDAFSNGDYVGGFLEVAGVLPSGKGIKHGSNLQRRGDLRAVRPDAIRSRP